MAAALGSLGAALATMVANLSAHKRGWDDRWEEFSDWADRGKAYHDELLRLVDADTAAFDELIAAFAMPNDSDGAREARHRAIQAATEYAIEIPLQVMEISLASMDVIAAMAQTGLAASVSDAGVAALCARSAVMGAYLNVKINAGQLSDQERAAGYVAQGRVLQEQAVAREAEILERVDRRL